MTQTDKSDRGGGLILRQATAADIEELVAFNAEIHRGPSMTPDQGIAAWTRDLVDGRHPSTRLDDVTIVEDCRTHQIVSSAMLISQTWSYAGISFGVGQPELIGTHPSYRRRGLVREQFEYLHRLSAERGNIAEVIRGIPYFYRQFGYEFALSMNEGRGGYAINLATAPSGKSDTYRLRPVVEGDLPFIALVDDHARQRHLVACVRNIEQWHYELFVRSTESREYRVARLIESTDGQPVGYLLHFPQLVPRFGGHQTFVVDVYELIPNCDWQAVTSSVLHYVQNTGRDYATRASKPWDAFGFRLGSEHPVYDMIPWRLPVTFWRYGWYVRVANLPIFLQHIASVLERRLSASILAGFSGEVKVSFYQSGLQLAFETGRLTQVSHWTPSVEDEGTAMFPGRSFLQLMFGHRSLEELEYAFIDCQTFGDRNRLLLKVLFPKHASQIRAFT